MGSLLIRILMAHLSGCRCATKAFQHHLHNIIDNLGSWCIWLSACHSSTAKHWLLSLQLLRWSFWACMRWCNCYASSLCNHIHLMIDSACAGSFVSCLAVQAFPSYCGHEGHFKGRNEGRGSNCISLQQTPDIPLLQRSISIYTFIDR